MSELRTYHTLAHNAQRTTATPNDNSTPDRQYLYRSSGQIELVHQGTFANNDPTGTLAVIRSYGYTANSSNLLDTITGQTHPFGDDKKSYSNVLTNHNAMNANG